MSDFDDEANEVFAEQGTEPSQSQIEEEEIAYQSEQDIRNTLKYTGGGAGEAADDRVAQFSVEHDFRNKSHHDIQYKKKGALDISDEIRRHFHKYHLAWRLIQEQNNSYFECKAEGYTPVLKYGKEMKVSAGNSPGAGFLVLMCVPNHIYFERMRLEKEANDFAKKAVFRANAGLQVQKFDVDKISEQALNDSQIDQIVESNRI